LDAFGFVLFELFEGRLKAKGGNRDGHAKPFEKMGNLAGH
jgi:hypothetical protein